MNGEGKTHVVIVGLGNIGSQLVPLLGRLPDVAKIILIDHDTYAASNVGGQNITPAEFGRPKVVVQAARLFEIRPELRVTPLFEKVETVPLGELAAEVVVGCLDALGPRRIVSEATMRLGRPLVDAGVQADGALARVTVQGPQSACLQCLWSERDYARAGQRYACHDAAPAAFPTNAPAWLGGLAASFAAAEVARLLRGDFSVAGKELLLDAQQQRLTVTRLLRREACRFDHAPWQIEALGSGVEETVFGALFSRVPANSALRVWDHPWVNALVCSACQQVRPTLQLLGRLRGALCECGAELRAVGLHICDTLAAADLPKQWKDQPLARAGIRDGDVLALTHANSSAYLKVGGST